jgi:tetratricopeptide (TPR) repeat protein
LLAEDSIGKATAVFKKVLSLKMPPMISRNMAIYNIPFLKDILAQAYQRNGETDKAITEYERLINFDPNQADRFLIHPKYHYRLAKLYEEKGENQKAIQGYQKFLIIWKNADDDLPEKIDAQKRLARLTGG